MQDAGVAGFGQRHRAGSVRGEAAFELVAGRGADEFAGFAGKKLVDGAGIFALDRLAGEDDGAAIDFALGKAGIGVAAADEFAQRERIDGFVRQKRREQDRRTPDDLAADDDEAAGKPLRLPLQGDLGEQKVRGRAADIDADRFELDVFLAPDRARDRGALGLGHRVFVQEIGLVHRQSHNASRAVNDQSAARSETCASGNLRECYCLRRLPRTALAQPLDRHRIQFSDGRYANRAVVNPRADAVKFRLNPFVRCFHGRNDVTVAIVFGGNMISGFSRKAVDASRSRVFFGGEILIDSELRSGRMPHQKCLRWQAPTSSCSPADPLPNQFDLFIRKTNERRRAVVTWSNGRQLGVAYRPHSGGEEKWSLASMLQKMLGGADA